MDRNDSSDAEEIVNVYSYSYDGPQLYNYEPAIWQREQGQARIRQNKVDKFSCGVRRTSGEQGRCLGERPVLTL